MTLSTRLVSFSEEAPAISLVRNSVFSEEQGVDPAIDFDGLDGEAFHVLCRDDDKPVGTGRMLDDGHIGRVAVLRDYRLQGVGSHIMALLIDTARTHAFRRVYLNAQVDAVPFYDKLGFKPTGKNFVEAGILHTPMSLILKP